MSSNKTICLQFYTKDPESGKWKCQRGKLLSKMDGTGWSNLYSHLKTQHSEALKKLSLKKKASKLDEDRENLLYGMGMLRFKAVYVCR